MKVLSISYKGKEISRAHLTSPLVLIGRSPLCDVLLRAPEVESVHFILEWLGEQNEFSAETAYQDEWVLTEVGELGQNAQEKKVSQSSVGQGRILHEKPLVMKDLTFAWVEDRLRPADLSKKILSLQLPDFNAPVEGPKGKNIPSVLEVICINRDVSSVTDVHHFSFMRPSDWQTPLLAAFSAIPQVGPGVKAVELSLPHEAKSQVLHQGKRQTSNSNSKVILQLNDLLHVEWHHQEYYFRVVPKVMGPASRRSLWSDPFYLISLFCMLIGGFGFYLVFRNVQNEDQTIVVPPRIANIQVLEVEKPKPPPPLPETKPPQDSIPLPEEPPPPEPEKMKAEQPPEPKGMIKEADHVVAEKIAPNVKVDIQDKNSKQMKNAPKVVDKNKGSLDIPAEKAVVNRTGFLAALKKNKNVGMVKADQIVDKGLINDSIKGDKGNFVLEQSASGIVNNRISKSGDALSAASTKVNTKDAVGSGSFNAGRGDVLKEGFKANYGVSGEGGLSGSSMNGMMEAQVEGGLDKASVQSAIRGYKSEIRTCYEKALIVKAGVGGRVAYKFQINPGGSVVWINVYKSDVDSSTLVKCVQGVVNRIVFPKAKNGQSTIVIYPFQFERKGAGK